MTTQYLCSFATYVFFFTDVCVRACVRACGRACVSADVRVSVRACVRSDVRVVFNLP